MKNQKAFYLTFIIMNVIGISIFIILFVNNRGLSDSLKTIHKDNEMLSSGMDSIRLLAKESDIELATVLNENTKYKKLKANYFPVFARNFLDNVFDSKTFFIENSEQFLMRSSIEGDNFVMSESEYSSIQNFKNKKSRVSNNIIYLYETIYEYDPKGSDQGIQLYFSKNSSGEWKLIKIMYEGC